MPIMRKRVMQQSELAIMGNLPHIYPNGFSLCPPPNHQPLAYLDPFWWGGGEVGTLPSRPAAAEAKANKKNKLIIIAYNSFISLPKAYKGL